MLNITDVRILKMRDRHTRKGLLGFAKIVIDDCFLISGIKILKSDKLRNNREFMIAMPSQMTKRGYTDVCHPCDQKTRKIIEDAIIEKYLITEIQEP